MSEEKDIKREPGKISRREFLRDAGIVVGGTAVSSAFFLSACGKEVEVTKTVTDTVTKYVCPVCKQEFDSLNALKSHFDADHADGEAGGLKTLHLTVNGKPYSVEVKPNWTLQDVLREKLGYMSPKDMCFGYGACGSCGVIVNGRPILSCMTLAIQCNNATIETAEGIADSKHKIVDTYIKYHCAQCGYCTPGFLITAKALLDRNPQPNEEDIRETLAGNICRCGTYPAHIKAVLEAAG